MLQHSNDKNINLLEALLYPVPVIPVKKDPAKKLPGISTRESVPSN
jgi:hypothetical protein